jgi:hypothetical protein
MLHIRIKLLFFFLAFAHISIGQSVKSVHKHIAEKDFEKAKEKIEKLRAKDTFQLAALYLNSLYFLDSANRKINIDSAYLLTNVVLAKYKYLNINDKKQKEQQDDLQDAGFSAAKMGEQKLKIEANVFEYTQRKDNTVIGWQIYLQKYPTAKQVLQAEEKRNELAFAFAQKENTFQAYKTFIDKYPQAKQVEEAKKSYEKRLYETETADGSIESYGKFLRKYPNTPFKREIDDKIFALFVKDFGIETYKTFLIKYPENQNTHKAWAWIWYLTEEKESFLKTYPDFPAKDFAKQYMLSLKMPLYAVLEKDKMSMIDNEGNLVVNTPFEFMGEEDRCKVVEKYMLVGGVGEKAGAIDRLGNLIIPFEYDYLEYVGKGVFIAEKNKKQGTVFAGLAPKSGEQSNESAKTTSFEVLPCEWQELEAVAENELLRYKKGEKYGLFFYNGIKLLEATFDKISRFRGDTLLFTKGKDNGFYTPNQLLALHQASFSGKNKQEIALKLPFTSYEISHKVFPKIKYGESFGIYNLDGTELIKGDKKQIKEVPNGWLVQEHEGTWQLFNFAGQAIGEKYDEMLPQQKVENYVNILYGFTIRQGKKYGIADRNLKVILALEYDKIQWLNDKMVLATQANKVFIATTEGSKNEIQNAKDLTISYIKTEMGEENKMLLLVTNKKTKKQGVMNKEGNYFLPLKYDNLQATANGLFIFSQKKLQGLINLEAKQVLQPKYQQITFKNKAYILTDKKKKMGLYVFRNKKFLVESTSTEVLLPYSDSLLALTSQKGATLSLADTKGKPLLKDAYSKIEFWTDSVAMVKLATGGWKLYDLVKRKYTGDTFDDFKYLIKTKNEKVLITYRGKGFGLLSNRRGNLIPEDYSFLLNIGTEENPFYFVEVYVSQAEIHVILYMDKDGKVVRKQTVSHADYEKISCE